MRVCVAPEGEGGDERGEGGDLQQRPLLLLIALPVQSCSRQRQPRGRLLSRQKNKALAWRQTSTRLLAPLELGVVDSSQP